MGSDTNSSNSVRIKLNCRTPSWYSRELLGVGQRSPTFLAPGTGFVGDNFSMDGGGGGGGWFGDDYIYCALSFYYYCIVIFNEIIIQLTIMLTGGGAQVVMQEMGSGCKYR